MIYAELFFSFLLIGCFSFGGGYAMLPLIERQATDQGWMTTEYFTDAIAISGMLPGSIGINAATFVGYQMAGLSGALVATIGMILPSFSLILFIGKHYSIFESSKYTAQAFYGLRPVIVGLIMYSAIKFTLSLEIAVSMTWQSLTFAFIFMIALTLLFYKKIPAIYIILLAGIGGVFLYR